MLHLCHHFFAHFTDEFVDERHLGKGVFLGKKELKIHFETMMLIHTVPLSNEVLIAFQLPHSCLWLDDALVCFQQILQNFQHNQDLVNVVSRIAVVRGWVRHILDCVLHSLFDVEVAFCCFAFSRRLL
jgi:hypothetical protein